MSQDTRKDKRAKVVSLNVRYKSATVDEFIENHSHDVSKGGIFVKTPTPFPPGTLLKFEIRLAGDKSVISGVGRVVWKREPTQAATEKPAGMGVKFIKIDDASRAVIDQLTEKKADAGKAYTSDPAGLEDERAAATSTGGATSVTEITAARSQPTPESVPAPITKPLPAPPPSSPTAAIPKTASVVTARPTVGAMAKTLPLGSTPPPNLGPTTQKSPSVTAIPAASAAPASAAVSGPPAPIKLRPATAIGVAPQANTPPATPAAAPAPPPPSAPTVTAAASSSKPSTSLPAATPAPAPAPAPAAASPRPIPNPRKATMMGVAPAANPVAAAAQAQAAAAKAAAAAAAAAEGKSVSSSGLVNDNDDTQQFFQSATPKAPAVGAETPKAPPATMADAFLGGIDKPAEKKPAAGPMFPISDRPEEPVKEPTMMKQAAELLEEALREAGGSMEEIGNNPLFNQAKPKGVAPSPSAPRDQSGDTVVMSKSSMSTPPPPVTQPVSKPAASVPPPSMQPRPTPPASTVPARSVPPPAKPIGASLREPEKKGSMGLIIALVAVVVLVGGGVFAYGKFASKTDDTPKPPPSTTASVSATPVMATPDAGAPVALVDAATSAAVPAVVDAGSTATETAATKDAGATPEVVATAKPVVKPRPKPKPKPTATATSTGDTDTPPAATTTETPAPPPPPPTSDPMQTAPEL